MSSMMVYNCPTCGTGLDVHVMGMSSNLGPPVVICHRCKQTVSCERLEWDDMARRTKVFYAVVSIVYTAAVGLLGGMAVQVTATLFREGSMRFPSWSECWSDPVFWTGAVIYGTLTVLLQIYRVKCSRRRSTTKPGEPFKGLVFNLQRYMQAKVLVLVLIVPAIVWLVWWIRGKL
jgi:hypothetical protein